MKLIANSAEPLRAFIAKRPSANLASPEASQHSYI
jgi:hypothetical protein